MPLQINPALKDVFSDQEIAMYQDLARQRGMDQTAFDSLLTGEAGYKKQTERAQEARSAPGREATEAQTQRDLADLNREPFDIGKHGGGTPTAENIQALAGPQQSGAPDLGAFANLSPEEWAQINGTVDQQAGIAPAAAPRELSEAELRDQKYGNDMAFLDPEFDTKAPTLDEIKAYGTTGDEAARDRQLRDADELFGLYEKGGRGAQDDLARAKARRESEDWLRGQREADMGDLAERGMAGSGAEIATLLGDRQNAASRLSMADQQASADAEKRALDALMGGTEISSDVRKGADDYVLSNANMIAGINKTTADGRRTALNSTLDRRGRHDLAVLGHQVDAATGAQDRALKEQGLGYSLGGELAGGDADRTNTAQQGVNQTQVGTFTGAGPGIAGASADRIGKTGGTQAAAGRSASAGGKVIMDVVSSIGGGAGGASKGGETNENNQTNQELDPWKR